jgi:hypothetical protein
MNIYLIYLTLLTLIQRKREREYQRLQKETEDKQKLYLDWAPSTLRNQIGRGLASMGG